MDGDTNKAGDEIKHKVNNVHEGLKFEEEKAREALPGERQFLHGEIKLKAQTTTKSEAVAALIDEVINAETVQHIYLDGAAAALPQNQVSITLFSRNNEQNNVRVDSKETSPYTSERNGSASQFNITYLLFLERSGRIRVEEPKDGHCGIHSLQRSKHGLNTLPLRDVIGKGRKEMAAAIRNNHDSLLVLLQDYGLKSDQILERANMHEEVRYEEVCSSDHWVGGFYSLDLIAWSMETKRKVCLLVDGELSVTVHSENCMAYTIHLSDFTPSAEDIVMICVDDNHFEALLPSERTDNRREDIIDDLYAEQERLPSADKCRTLSHINVVRTQNDGQTMDVLSSLEKAIVSSERAANASLPLLDEDIADDTIEESSIFTVLPKSSQPEEDADFFAEAAELAVLLGEQLTTSNLSTDSGDDWSRRASPDPPKTRANAELQALGDEDDERGDEGGASSSDVIERASVKSTHRNAKKRAELEAAKRAAVTKQDFKQAKAIQGELKALDDEDNARCDIGASSNDKEVARGDKDGASSSDVIEGTSVKSTHRNAKKRAELEAAKRAAVTKQDFKRAKAIQGELKALNDEGAANCKNCATDIGAIVSPLVGLL